jgi:hypothetical protein
MPLCLSVAANDANHARFVITSPSREPNRIVGKRDNHCQAPNGSDLRIPRAIFDAPDLENLIDEDRIGNRAEG